MYELILQFYNFHFLNIKPETYIDTFTKSFGVVLSTGRISVYAIIENEFYYDIILFPFLNDSTCDIEAKIQKIQNEDFDFRKTSYRRELREDSSEYIVIEFDTLFALKTYVLNILATLLEYYKIHDGFFLSSKEKSKFLIYEFLDEKIKLTSLVASNKIPLNYKFKLRKIDVFFFIKMCLEVGINYYHIYYREKDCVVSIHPFMFFLLKDYMILTNNT